MPVDVTRSADAILDGDDQEPKAVTGIDPLVDAQRGVPLALRGAVPGQPIDAQGGTDVQAARPPVQSHAEGADVQLIHRQGRAWKGPSEASLPADELRVGALGMTLDGRTSGLYI